MIDFGLTQKANKRLTQALNKSVGSVIVGDASSAIEAAKELAETLDHLGTTQTYGAATQPEVTSKVADEFLERTDSFKVGSVHNKSRDIIEGVSG